MYIFVWSYSSVASPICQEGQSKRTLLIFCLFYRFFLFFPNFGKFFAVRGGTLPPLPPLPTSPPPPPPPRGYATVIISLIVIMHLVNRPITGNLNIFSVSCEQYLYLFSDTHDCTHKAKKKKCYIGVTRPTLKLGPTLLFFFFKQKKKDKKWPTDPKKNKTCDFFV